MRTEIPKSKRQQIRGGKKHVHWGILTLDDLDKTNVKNSQLIIQLQAQYKVAKELGDGQKSTNN